METAVVMKAGLGLISLAGVSSAVAVPLFLKNERSSSPLNTASNAGGGVNQFSIKMCQHADSSGWTDVDFGSKGVGSICWSVESPERFKENPETYTKLFKEKWGESQNSWSSSNKNGSIWKTVCGTFWVISVQGSGEEYVGVCEWDKGGKSSFVKKTMTDRGKNIKSVKLSICHGSCFQLTDYVVGSPLPEELKEPVSQEWFNVSFKSENKHAI